MCIVLVLVKYHFHMKQYKEFTFINITRNYTRKIRVKKSMKSLWKVLEGDPYSRALRKHSGKLISGAGSSITVQMVCLFQSNILGFQFLISVTLHSLILRSQNKNTEYPANVFFLQTTAKIQIPSILFKDIFDMYLNIMRLFLPDFSFLLNQKYIEGSALARNTKFRLFGLNWEGQKILSRRFENLN